MKLITRDTDYALRALCFVAKSKDRVVSVSQLVDSLKIPRPFLRKNLQLLNKRGVLKSYKGLGGGFQLAQKPRQLFISDLMRIFQGPFKLNECFLKKRPCPHKKECVLKKKIDNIERYVIGQLNNITLADLL
ncbi:MAG: Rrf2 family transcriptional regulator [Candidatus Omnitrophota bacterium]